MWQRRRHDAGQRRHTGFENFTPMQQSNYTASVATAAKTGSENFTPIQQSNFNRGSKILSIRPGFIFFRPQSLRPPNEGLQGAAATETATAVVVAATITT